MAHEYSQFRNSPITCKACGWTGLGRECQVGEVGTAFPIADLPPGRPCPFCGSTDLDIESCRGEEVGADLHQFVAHVKCLECGVEGPRGTTEPGTPQGVLDAVRDAAEWWNGRFQAKRKRSAA